ncbi:cytochrome P450 [Xylariomycetidae sp. FL2044]|nr:cytochrome P450 [Xylariomycetidae sp. FL2044]
MSLTDVYTRNYTRRTHEPFAIQLLGKKLYVITGPTDVAAVYRDTAALGFDGHLNQLLENFGFGADAIKRSWHKPEPGSWCYIPNNPVNPNQLNFIHLTEDIYKKQLLPGQKMDEMCRLFMKALQNTLDWDRLDFCTTSRQGPSHRQISLYSMCRFAIVDATTRSMFGSHLHELEPDIVDCMLRFNDYAWMVFFQYPDLLGGLPVTEPRRKIIEVMKKFIQLPKEKRHEQSWSIENIIEAQEIVGIDLEARASVILLIFWAANSNEYNISFWVIAHLLYDEALLAAVKQETEQAWPGGELDIKHLCANCPQLESLFHEALRLNGGAMVSRVVLRETVVGGKTLSPGNAVLMPSRQLHTNEDVWGDTVRDFDPARFLGKKKSLARHSSFRPFGGGATYCPGRVLAKEEVYGFVAILLHRFDIKLATRYGEKPPFPRLNDTTPALGITGPLKSMDVMVDVTLRK